MLIKAEAPLKSRWPLGSLIVLASGTFVMVCIQMGTSGLVSDIADGLGTSEGLVAFSITAFSLAVSISTIPMFLLLRRRSRKSVLVIAFAAAGAACIAASVADNVAWFTVSRAIGGVAHALFSMSSIAYIVLTVETRYLGRSLTVAGSGSALAVWLGIPLMTWVGKGEPGWHVAFLGLGVATLVVSALVFVKLPGDSVPPSLGDAARSGWWRKEEWSGTRRAFSIVAQANTACVIYAAAYFVVFSYIGIWLNEVARVSGQELVMLLLVSGTGSVVGMLVAGPISDLWGTKWAQTLLTFVMMVEALVLVAVGVSGSGSVVRVLAMFLLGVPGGAFAVTQQARAADLTPVALQPATAAGLTIAGNGGMAVSGMLGGFFVASGVSWALPWATVGLAVIALIVDRMMEARLSMNEVAA